jgi:MerR family redox-sensitive transcriptional activator SoxR
VCRHQNSSLSDVIFGTATERLLVQVELRSRGIVIMLTIGQVASRAGLRASAIRYYEAQGLLPTAPRKSGKRIYDASVLERLGVIELAKTAGFDLEEIRALVSRGGDQPALAWRDLSRAKRTEIDRQIARLARMKDVLERLSKCTCATLGECGRAFNVAHAQQPPQVPLEPTARFRSLARPLTRRGPG